MAMLDDVDSIPDLTSDGRKLRREIYHEFLRQHVPEEIYRNAVLVNERARGQLSWEPMQHRIERLEQLQTMKQLMTKWKHRSTELTYRQIFQTAMIRVEIDGRIWFMDAPEKGIQYPLLMPLAPKESAENPVSSNL